MNSSAATRTLANLCSQYVPAGNTASRPASHRSRAARYATRNSRARMRASSHDARCRDDVLGCRVRRGSLLTGDALQHWRRIARTPSTRRPSSRRSSASRVSASSTRARIRSRTLVEAARKDLSRKSHENQSGLQQTPCHAQRRDPPQRASGHPAVIGRNSDMSVRITDVSDRRIEPGAESFGPVLREAKSASRTPSE
jgi:hypothetical protein